MVLSELVAHGGNALTVSHLFLNSYLKTLRKFTGNRCLGWETASSHPSYKWVEQHCNLPQGVTAGQLSMLFLPIGRKLFGI